MLTKTRTGRLMGRAISTLTESDTPQNRQRARLATLVRNKFALGQEGEIKQITLTHEEYKKTFES